MQTFTQNSSLEQLLQGFLDYRKSRISRRFYVSTSFVLIKWREEIAVNTPHEITPKKLQDWFDQKSKEVKPATAASYLDWIRVFLDWCVTKEILEKNPVLKVDVPRISKPFRRRFVSAATVRILITNCDDPELKYCLFCGFHSGLRFNEVIMSRPEWFDIEQGVLHVIRNDSFETKDHEDRTIPITDEFSSFLRKYGLRQPYMIAPQANSVKAPYRFTFRKRFLSYVHKHGVDISFHDTRRTFASLHVSSGTSVYKIAKWLGDGVQVVERHYGHLMPSDCEVNRPFVSNYEALRKVSP